MSDRPPQVVEVPEPVIPAGDVSFRYRRRGERVLITSDLGSWLRVSTAEFEDIVAGRLAPDSPLRRQLVEGGFVPGEMDTDGAAARFEAAGGKIVVPPFDIQIGRAVVVQDPWGNQFVLLDASKGLLVTDADGNVIGNAPVNEGAEATRRLRTMQDEPRA